MGNHEKKSGAISLFVAGIQTGGFGARLFGYIVFFTVLVILETLLLLGSSSGHNAFTRFLNGLGTLLPIVVLAAPALLMFFWERSIRKFRRKHGLSIYKNVREELEQMEINERVAKEHKAFVANGIAGADSGKKDLDYWFGLLQKGAITQDEYNVKKSELMAG